MQGVPTIRLFKKNPECTREQETVNFKNREMMFTFRHGLCHGGGGERKETGGEEENEKFPPTYPLFLGWIGPF